MNKNTDRLYLALLLIDCRLNQGVGDVEGHRDMKGICCSDHYTLYVTLLNWLAI